MDAVGGLLATVSVYVWPALLLLAEVAAALFLLGGFLRLRRQRREDENGAKAFLKAISPDQNEMWILFRREDQYPLYAAGDLEEKLGFTLEELRSDAAVLNRVTSSECARRLLQAYRAWDGQAPLENTFSDGAGEWYSVTVRRCLDDCCELVSLRSITVWQQQIAAMEHELDEVRSESRSKTTFLSQMSHEIRTPMNGIIGMLTLIRAQLQDQGGEQVLSYLDKAENLSQHLLSLINDILDMSRIEAGRIELVSEPFDLFALGDRLRNMFQKNAEAKGLCFSLEFQEFDVRYLVGDELRLSQVIINFLSNAVKFTDQGEVTVTFRQMLRQGDQVDLMIRIHDTGKGMEPEFINRIFRPFEQENADISKKYGGTGLGMAITDQIVRLMGGEIFVESLPHFGTDFTVFLSFPAAEEALVLPASAPDTAEEDDSFSFRGLRILLAEDNEINAEIATGVLEDMEGAKVEVAVNGRIAVDKFAGSPPGTYDLILMDIQMPVLDGRSAAREIRQLNRFDAGEIPIFALSADAFVEDERLSAEMGMNGHFAKPIDFDELRRRIGHFLRERGKR